MRRPSGSNTRVKPSYEHSAFTRHARFRDGYLFQTTSVLLLIGSRRFVWKGKCREFILLVRMRHILKNRVDHLHALRIQEPDLIDERLPTLDSMLNSRQDGTYSNTARSESATRKSHQNNLISRLIIRSDETVHLSDILSQSARLTHFSKQVRQTSEIPIPKTPPMIISDISPVLPTPGW